MSELIYDNTIRSKQQQLEDVCLDCCDHVEPNKTLVDCSACGVSHLKMIAYPTVDMKTRTEDN